MTDEDLRRFIRQGFESPTGWCDGVDAIWVSHQGFSERDAAARVRLVSQMVIDSFLSIEANRLRYGPEDALRFLQWMEERFPEAILFTVMDFEND